MPSCPNQLLAQRNWHPRTDSDAGGTTAPPGCSGKSGSAETLVPGGGSVPRIEKGCSCRAVKGRPIAGSGLVAGHEGLVPFRGVALDFGRRRWGMHAIGARSRTGDRGGDTQNIGPQGSQFARTLQKGMSLVACSATGSGFPCLGTLSASSEWVMEPIKDRLTGQLDTTTDHGGISHGTRRDPATD